MLLEKIRSHNYVNGLVFSAAEFLFAALVTTPFFIYYVLHSRALLAVLAAGLILNFLTIVVFALLSKYRGEKSIGIPFYTNPALRRRIAETYPHLTADTLMLCASMLVPFVLLVVAVYESLYDKKPHSLAVLFWVTILNYVAQIPYYIHSYYIPYRVLPTLNGVVLLGLTLTWFLAGYFGVLKDYRYGYYFLLSFLGVETLFYAGSVASGAFLFQMQNPSLLIKSIFLMGYVSGAVSTYYAYNLIRRRF